MQENSNVRRVKYRSTPVINPECSVQTSSKSFSNKTAKIIKSEKCDDDKYKFDQNHIIMNPSFTQNTIVIGEVTSDELTLRRKQYPSIQDREEIQKKWEMINEKERQVLQKMESCLKSNTNEIDGAGKYISKKLIKWQSNIEKENGNDADEKIENDYVNLDEHTLALNRKSFALHNKVSKLKIYLRALNLSFSTFFTLFSSATEFNTTSVLPWLVIGTKDHADNSGYLLDNGFTHILNISSDIPNYFEKLFIYKKVDFSNDESENLMELFLTTIKFLNRVYAARGKVMVHASHKISYAVMVVLVYLIADSSFISSGMTLGDAYDIIITLMPYVSLCTKIRYNLFYFEITSKKIIQKKDNTRSSIVRYNYYSSVISRPFWCTYEVNVLVETHSVKKSHTNGVYFSALNMLTKNNRLFS